MSLLFSVFGHTARTPKPECGTLYGNALRAYEQKNYTLSCRILEEFVTKDRTNAQAHNLLGATYMQLQHAKKAAGQFAKAVECAGDNSSCLANLGHTLATLGEFDEASRCLRHALDIDPDNAPALYNWLIGGGLSESDLRRAEQLGTTMLAKGDDNKAILAHFTLGKLYDETNRFAEAFDHFTAGNRLKRATLNFDIAGVQTLAEEIKLSPVGQLVGTDNAPLASAARPIFIIGMPRSGSTLLERILAQQFGLGIGGELTAISEIAEEMSMFGNASSPASLHALTSEDRLFYANAYLRWLDQRFGTRVNIVDKYLFNFFNVGFIKQLFPDARFIDATRDPLDTCLSCYFTLFSVSNEFSYDIDELAQYYALYQGLMKHWKAAFPDNIATVTYRDVVDNKQRVVDFLRTALYIDDNHSFSAIPTAETPIYTASFAQARRPIYRDSLERWRRYGTRVEPLRQALLDAGVAL